MKRAVLVLLLLLCPTLALAAPAVTGPAPAPNAVATPAWMAKNHDEPPDPPPPPAAASRLRGVLAAFMVLSLIGFAVWTKTKKKNLAIKNPTAYVTVSDSVKVGEKAHLVVARIGDRTVVLGVTEHGVRRLMDIEVPKPVALAVARSSGHIKSAAKLKPAPSATTKASGTMLAAASIKSRFQSLLQRAKHPAARLQLATNDDADDTESSFDEEGTHWTEKLDDELRTAQNEAAEAQDSEAHLQVSPPGAVSAPMLRVANDTYDARVRMRLSGSSPVERESRHTIDPLGLEEQVSGLLTARARRS